MEKIEIVDVLEVPVVQVEGALPLSPGVIDLESAKKWQVDLVGTHLPEDAGQAEEAYQNLCAAYYDLANGVIQAVESGKVAFGPVE